MITSDLSHVAEGMWYISKFIFQHKQCYCSRANPSGAQLRGLPGFAAAVIEGFNTSKARVGSSLKRVGGVDVSNKSATLYRATQDIKTRFASDPVTELKVLLAYSMRFAENKPGSHVCCQLDRSG